MGALRPRPKRPLWRLPRPSMPSWCARASSSRRSGIPTSPVMCQGWSGASRARSGEWRLWEEAIQRSEEEQFMAAVSRRRRRPRQRHCGSVSCTACNARWRPWTPWRPGTPDCPCSTQRCRMLGWGGTRQKNNGMLSATSVVWTAISGCTRSRSWSVPSKLQWLGGRGRRRNEKRWQSPRPRQSQRRSGAGECDSHKSWVANIHGCEESCFQQATFSLLEFHKCFKLQDDHKAEGASGRAHAGEEIARAFEFIAFQFSGIVSLYLLRGVQFYMIIHTYKKRMI